MVASSYQADGQNNFKTFFGDNKISYDISKTMIILILIITTILSSFFIQNMECKIIFYSLIVI